MYTIVLVLVEELAILKDIINFWGEYLFILTLSHSVLGIYAFPNSEKPK